VMLKVWIKRMIVSTSLVVMPAVMMGCEEDSTEQEQICEDYCNDSITVCRDGNAQYASLGECLTTCSGYATTGDEGDTKGDTLQCRVYHLSVAETDPELHCPHSGPTGAGMCVDEVSDCDRYCAQMHESCQGSASPYESHTECEDTCANDIRAAQEETGNTVLCRINVLNATDGSMTKAQICEAAGPPGVSTTCVDETTEE